MDVATIVARERLDDLFAILRDGGCAIIGPRVADGAIVLGHLASADDLPEGLRDRQAPGAYRLENSGNRALFDYTLGPQGWKRYLYPPRQKLWQASRKGRRMEVSEPEADAPKQAFFGVRPCEIAALALNDRVFDNGTFSDPAYGARRHNALIIAVNCRRPAAGCFCASMGTGPRAVEGFDLALTEILGPGPHRFLVEAGSNAGREILEKLPSAPATTADRAAADQAMAEAARAMGREMPPEAAALLAHSLENPHWDEVGARCLGCGNCTMVCPTCFCTTVEDTTDLAGATAERWRTWDSCFSLDFSYIHGGSIRRAAGARYRQWITHKLSAWHEQFGASGCVGCGRCIVWCPVGIDITREVQVLAGPKAPGTQGGK